MPTKTRSFQTQWSWDGGKTFTPYIDEWSEFIDYVNGRKTSKYYTGFNYCHHYKCEPGSSIRFGSGVIVQPWSYRSSVPSSTILDYAKKQLAIELDFQQNDELEILLLLLEWDETLAMFGKDIAEQAADLAKRHVDLSSRARKYGRHIFNEYGKLTWGFMPLMSDVNSLVNTLSDIRGGMLKAYQKILGKRITRARPWELNLSDPNFDYRVSGVTRISGYIDGECILPQDPMELFSIFLDEIGFHPDLKTVWDGIPFSFVADYFVPIGDFLETLHPRGWFTPQLYITGGYSVKYTVHMYPKYPSTGDVAVHKWYIRSPDLPPGVSTRYPPAVKLEAPSFRELFNTLYLAISGIVNK